MYSLLKLGCLGIYVAAVASFAHALPAEWAAPVQIVAAVLLFLHALELVFVFRHVRLYSGPLAASVVLTLLFGLLHWKPLADAARKSNAS